MYGKRGTDLIGPANDLRFLSLTDDAARERKRPSAAANYNFDDKIVKNERAGCPRVGWASVGIEIPKE